MPKYIPHWYDEECERAVDPEIEAANEEEAVALAYKKHNGEPPAKLLYMEEVK